MNWLVLKDSVFFCYYFNRNETQYVFFLFVGSVIRCMRRLEELLRQMCQAAKAIGNTELENKFAEGEFINLPKVIY